MSRTPGGCVKVKCRFDSMFPQPLDVLLWPICRVGIHPGWWVSRGAAVSGAGFSHPMGTNSIWPDVSGTRLTWPMITNVVGARADKEQGGIVEQKGTEACHFQSQSTSCARRGTQLFISPAALRMGRQSSSPTAGRSYP